MTVATMEPATPTLDIAPEVESASLVMADPTQARRPQVMPAQPSAEQATRPVIELSIMKTSDQIGELIGALALAQGKFTEIERTLKAKIESTRAKYEYGYAPLDEVLQAVRPALSENGIAILQFPLTRSTSMVVRTMLAHKSGQWIYNELAAVCVSLDPQAIGSAITYLRRYAAMAICGVAPSYDDDGAAAGIGGAAAVPAAPTPARRKSEQGEAAPQNGTKPINVGLITEVAKRDGAAAITLDTGFKCASRDPEVIAGAEAFKSKQARVELITRPSADPAKYFPVLTEIVIQVGGQA